MNSDLSNSLNHPAIPVLAFISTAQMEKKIKPWETVAAFLVALYRTEPKHVAHYVFLWGGKVKPGLD